MPADIITEMVTLPRALVVDLLVEAHAVADVMEKMAGVCPTPFTDRMIEAAEEVALAVLGETSDNLDEGPRVLLWQAGERRANELLSSWISDQEG